MKLVRAGELGSEKPGVIDDTGVIRDLSELISDWDYRSLVPSVIEQVRSVDLSTLPALDADTRLGAPISRPGKIVGCALTYGKHAAEAGMEPPAEPMFMLTAASAITGPTDSIVIPEGGTQLDWEAELAVVFCQAGKNIPAADAMNYVAGFCTSNDVSERVFQLERGSQWTKGKSADTLKPLGPWLVTKDEVGDPNQLDISCQVNDETMQSSNTSDMMYSIAELVSILSNYVSWQPGDVLMTGTPPGVGYGMRPQQYLQPGDVVEVVIDKLGSQRSVVTSPQNNYSAPVPFV